MKGKPPPNRVSADPAGNRADGSIDSSSTPKYNIEPGDDNIPRILRPHAFGGFSGLIRLPETIGALIAASVPSWIVAQFIDDPSDFSEDLALAMHVADYTIVGADIDEVGDIRGRPRRSRGSRRSDRASGWRCALVDDVLTRWRGMTIDFNTAGRQRDDALPDLAPFIDPIARRILGPPNVRLSKPHQLRFGNNGSIVVEIAGTKKGTWFDHEPPEIRRRAVGTAQQKGGLANGEAEDWLRTELGIDVDAISANTTTAGRPKARAASARNTTTATSAASCCFR